MIHYKFPSDISEWLYKEQKCCGGGHSSITWRNGTNTRHDSQNYINSTCSRNNQTCNLYKNYLVIFRPSFSWHIGWENFLGFPISEGLVYQIERIIPCFSTYFFLWLVLEVGFLFGYKFSAFPLITQRVFNSNFSRIHLEWLSLSVVNIKISSIENLKLVNKQNSFGAGKIFFSLLCPAKVYTEGNMCHLCTQALLIWKICTSELLAASLP